MSPTTGAKIAVLADRGVVGITGADAAKLLQGVITNDMDLLSVQPAIHAALLTPQGKILFEFFVVKAPDGFWLEAAADKTAELAKRLALYRLRAKVDIKDRTAEYRAFALWGGAAQDVADGAGTLVFPDPRLPALGLRGLARAPLAPDFASARRALEVPEQDYHAHRIALGVPEGGKDYTFGDAFPHDADLDQLHGVSFAKGCFVGQEVVSRMQNRSQVRKRIVAIVGDSPLLAGAAITAGAAVIGTVGSVAGSDALALLRLDRAAEAAAKGTRLMAGEVAIALRTPDWANFALAPAAATGVS
ncbi:MAG: folate-binding protein YgfZ [Hyphomicrobiaceae bacterium]|nr:folate-binding protein YgfZ [Hyphomicrobiaceae bacterium]